MARIAILALFLTTLASGCVGSEPASEATIANPSDSAAADSEPAAAPAPAPAASDIPPCPTGQNNYGIDITIGDLYMMTGRSGNVLIVYKESNGCGSLQTEEERPTDPDTKIAELPYPMPLGPPAASANA